MLLLTFLGNPKEYHQTTYWWDGKEKQTRFAPVASCVFHNADRMIVFLTGEAERNWYQPLLEELPPGVAAEPVRDIPLGKKDTELWEIFNRICTAVPPEEEVVFDITHGFRSSPLITMLAAAFLRASNKINLKAVMYGAFEAAENNRTPMFDLTPMIRLLDWSAASDRFIRTGDARYLASLVREQQKPLALSSGSDKNRQAEAGRLGALSATLEEISQSLALMRPEDAMQVISDLPARLVQAQPALQRATGAAPFQFLLEEVNHSFQPLAHSQPRDDQRLVERLHVERGMIAWYAGHEYWMQAVCLGREWLVNWVMWKLGYPDLVAEARDEVEKLLNQAARGNSSALSALSPLPDAKTIANLWRNIGDTRNDILHAGMRKTPVRAKNLVAIIKARIADLEQLPI